MNETQAAKPTGSVHRLIAVLMVVISLFATLVDAQDETHSLFDGKSLEGWETLKDDAYLWKVVDGVITAGSLTETVPHNSFLATKRSYHNFDLRLKIRISGTEGFVNSGIQIRSVRLPNSHEMFGYQVDAGKGWWGKLYDESRRREVISQAADLAAVNDAVKENGWNEYRILVEGPRIRSWINGVPALDYTESDPNIALDGHIGIQVHGNGKTLVEVKDVTIQELPPTPNAPTWEKVGLPKTAWPRVKRKPQPKRVGKQRKTTQP
jgi:hypothetical protein